MAGVTKTVEMGETYVSHSEQDQLAARGIGACVALCLYDAVSRLAAMVHVVLPETVPLHLTSKQPVLPVPGRCADTAVQHVIEQVLQQGGRKDQLRAAIAGGAELFTHASQPSHALRETEAGRSRLEIGPRNVDAIRCALEAEGIPLVAEDVGGSYGRNLTFLVSTGEIFLRRIGGEEQILASLGAVDHHQLVTHREEALLAA